MLFHPDADPVLVAATERRMMKMTPENAAAMMGSFAGYDVNDSVRLLAEFLFLPMTLPAAADTEDLREAIA